MTIHGGLERACISLFESVTDCIGKSVNLPKTSEVEQQLAVLTWTATGMQAADYLKKTGHVNTYTFTKMLTEMAIGEHHNSSFPVAIVRPSIVVSPASLHVSPSMRRSRCREDV